MKQNDHSQPTERSPLISPAATRLRGASPRLRPTDLEDGQTARPRSIVSSVISKEEEALGNTAAGEILPYNDYSSIDFLHDLVKDAYRRRAIYSIPGIRGWFISRFDALSGWLAVGIAGIFTGFVAFMIDITEATISDYKFGYCSTNLIYSKETCCRLANGTELEGDACTTFINWDGSYGARFGPYVGIALLVGLVSAGITMLSKAELPSASRQLIQSRLGNGHKALEDLAPPKRMYMVAGAGVPEIKTILSGFVIPEFLGLKVLVMKAVGAVFAVASGLPLGKEAPLIHIGACVANLVAMWFPKYRDNGKQLREVIVAGSAAGVSAAFGAPIGGVLFAYEELSVYFPRKALYRTFLCSIMAAITLKLCNPFGTGKLVLFETKYGDSYSGVHYLVFVILGIMGGVWGGTFTKLNYYWARWFRKLPLIKSHPMLEVAIVVVAVASLQFIAPATRARYDVIIRRLLVDCRSGKADETWVCENEMGGAPVSYILWLTYGTLTVLATTTITAGIKVPSGIIMPALAGGALFGRLTGQFVDTSSISPGIFAMVAAGAFLAGITRMTISLCVIMFELTGELEYVVPHMISILCAKWTADFISKASIYDLTQSSLGHPFLSPDEAMQEVASAQSETAHVLIPPASTMAELTVFVPPGNTVLKKILSTKLDALKKRGLMDSGLVLVQGKGIVQGYIPQNELDFGLNEVGASFGNDAEVRVLGTSIRDGELDLSRFVNRAPICICANSPIEVVVAIFTQLGLRYICLTEEGTGALIGVVIRKRLMSYMDGIKHH